MKKALILDFGGVISRTLFETHATTEAALGLTPGTLRWRGPFDRASDPLWADMQAGKLSERDYWLARSREVGALLGERWDKMETFVQRARGADPDAVVRPQTRALIEQAHDAGLKLAILSNELDLFYGAGFRGRLSLLARFEVIVDASHTGILKPDPRAYRRCLTELGMRAPDCVFVDDQRKNHEGALALGIASVLFDVMDPQRSCDEARAALGLG